MDFFERQDRARRNTKLLIAYFVAGVAALILALYVAAALVFSGVSSRHPRYTARYYNDQPQVGWWNPRLFGGVALGTLAVIAMGSIFKTLELAQGGSVVATTLGGRLISPGSADPDERRLLNVVEEMALASGVPVPQVYVLPDEEGINAFAAGHSTSDAVVAVTAGTLKLLTRDEMQGVIGHEFSHILNGDMRLNLRLMGIIFGIVCLAVIGRILLYARGDRDNKGKNVLPLFGLALILVGWVGVFFGRLIQAAVSRQREFLADASAIQFTRNPAGLAGALKKIGGYARGSRIENPHAGEVSHMFFGNGMGGSFLHMLDTHPPLAERIRAIDPGFDGNFSDVTAPRPAALAEERRSPVAFPTSQRAQSGIARLAPVIGVAAVLPNAGNPTPAHIRYAEELRGSIPPQLQAEARQPLGACALIYALLLSSDETARHKQLEELSRVAGPGVIQETLRILPAVHEVAAHARLPLVDLTLPALRHLSLTQFQQFKRAVQMLVESDEAIDLFEYVLQKIVVRHLEPQFADARRPVIQYYALKPLATDCAVLLSALARAGQTEPDQIQRAFQQGASILSAAAQVELQLVSPEECDLAQLDTALNRLALAVPQIKKNVLYACALTVAADSVIQELEAELLRAIGDTLDCPMPPFIAAA